MVGSERGVIVYTVGNQDNIDKAVEGLNQFTKNWCMNCKETDSRNELIFRCKECNFKGELGVCKIKNLLLIKQVIYLSILEVWEVIKGR